MRSTLSHPLALAPHPTHIELTSTDKDYPGGVEYFDVYSPMIKQLYSQVFWTGLAPVSLPQEIIERYDDKGMAVVVRRLILCLSEHPSVAAF